MALDEVIIITSVDRQELPEMDNGHQSSKGQSSSKSPIVSANEGPRQGFSHSVVRVLSFLFIGHLQQDGHDDT